MTDVARKQPRLVLLCGLPASGKTTLAREIADAYGAVRLNPDEWELALGIDPFDAEFQAKLEAAFSGLTERLLALGTSVILDWGFWARSERDEKRDLGRSLGAAAMVVFLSGITFAFIEAPALGWSSPVVLTMAALGVIGLAVFLAWERRAASPMLPLSV